MDSEEKIISVLEKMSGRIDQIVEEQKAVDSRTAKLEIMLENTIIPQLKLLAEGHEMILERMPDASELYALKERVKILESVVKQHSIEINNLKKAT